MVIRTQLTVGGTVFPDVKNLRVQITNGDYNSSAFFRALFDSPFGRHDDDFIIGKEIIIKANKDANPTTTIFTGILERVSFTGNNNTQQIFLSGRDFSARLQDATVEPKVFTNSEISTIVKDIIDNNVSDITTTNVNVTKITLPRIAFNHTPVFDALQQLAELAGFRFYVDINKDIHFEEKDSSDSGITLNTTNIVRGRFDTTREGIANKVFVYGARQLTGNEEFFSGGSPFDDALSQAGSVFTLASKPFHTEVRTSDFPGSVLKGGIFNLFELPISGGRAPDYFVNFEDRQIILVSGTEVGKNNLITSGGSVVVNYDRETPLVRFGQSRPSIDAFGPKTLVINDKAIKDPDQAKNILNRALEQGTPLDKAEFELKGFFTFTIGQTVQAILSDFDINEPTWPILNITYTFDKNTVESERVIKIRLNNKITDITDTITELSKRLRALEAEDLQEGDFITRLEFGLGSFLVVGSRFQIKTRDINDSFILGLSGVNLSTQLGIVGSPNTGSIISLSTMKWISGLSSTTLGFDRALGFNGSPDHIRVPDNSTIDMGTDDFSISAWINTGSQGNMLIIDKHSTGPGGIGYRFGIDTSERLFLTLRPVATATLTVNSTGSVNLSSDVHVAVTADRDSNATFYINGSQDGVVDISSQSSSINNSNDLFIGALRGINDYYTGSMDEMRIYKNKILTLAEVGSLNAKVNYPIDNLFAYWPMDEGTTVTNAEGSRIYSYASGNTYFPQRYLGDRRSSLTTVASGGFDYTTI